MHAPRRSCAHGAARRSFLGVGRENVFFFEQGCMPCLTFEGKFILESGGVLAQAPDGNGGVWLRACSLLIDLT